MEAHMKALVSLSIIEKDINGDVLLAWSYPDCDSELEKVFISRSSLKQDTIPLQFTFSKFKQNWLYIFIHGVTPNKPATLKNVVAFSICFVATDYNPEKYLELCKTMSAVYQLYGEPPKLLEGFISVFVKGGYVLKSTDLQLTFNSNDFDIRKAYLSTSIKEIIKMFGQEIIIIWNALITKKRIAVYSPKLGILLRVIRAFPLLVFHRQNWDILRPFVTLDDVELNDVKNAQVYCAGFIDESIKEREDLYDILVDVNNRSVNVASHAKAYFEMTAFHKEVCEFLVTNSEDPNVSDQDIIKGLIIKTKDLLSKIEKLKVQQEDGTTSIDLKALESKGLAPKVVRFLYGVATAETTSSA